MGAVVCDGGMGVWVIGCDWWLGVIGCGRWCVCMVGSVGWLYGSM